MDQLNGDITSLDKDKQDKIGYPLYYKTRTLDDWDNANIPGWYCSEPGATNAPENAFCYTPNQKVFLTRFLTKNTKNVKNSEKQ